MNYIYDILVNFKDKLYDFYDWNVNDDITHIRKIPLFKINTKNLSDIKKNKVKVEKEWLDKIKEKTEVFANRNVSMLDYACLFSDGMEVLAITFKSNGESLYKSKLLLDEDYEVIEVCERISESNINYEIIKKEEKDEFKTRKEMEIDGYIKEQIRILNYDENIDKLKYIYYECFNKKINDKKKILNDINLELNNNWNNIAFKLYNFFKLTSINK